MKTYDDILAGVEKEAIEADLKIIQNKYDLDGFMFFGTKVDDVISGTCDMNMVDIPVILSQYINQITARIAEEMANIEELDVDGIMERLRETSDETKAEAVKKSKELKCKCGREDCTAEEVAKRIIEEFG